VRGPAVAALPLLLAAATDARAAGSLRFFGNGVNDIDRVKVAIDAPPRPADVALDFTLEWWMKAAAAENPTSPCAPGEIGSDAWIFGNIVFDRDVYGNGDFGDWGVSLLGGRVVFGVGQGPNGQSVCGSTSVADGQWHHVALTRRSSDGRMQVFVDGALQETGVGPPGNVSYRDGRPTQYPASDPFLVFGAEKHDAGPAYPSYSGWLDEVRLSRVVRYVGPFQPPRAPFVADSETVALYHMDEGTGDLVGDSSGAPGGPSHGQRRFGGSPAGPLWSPDTPMLQLGSFVAMIQRATGLAAPLGIANAGDGTNRLFVVEQGGRIRIWNGTAVLPTPFLDIGALVVAGGEQGLLGLAFHPSYDTNGFFFVNYTCRATAPGCTGDGDTIVARYQRSAANPDQADPASARVLFVVDQPFPNHNGGHLAFGPDGYLYIGLGDGGAGGDPLDVAQDLSTRPGNQAFLGKMLRIDVDQSVGAPPFYGIPPTNPYVGPGDPPDEIWAYGLRNPWRYSFDRETGDLFIGDVGQESWEEIDFQAAGAPGGQNYGWDVLEGGLHGPQIVPAGNCFEDVPAGSCVAFLGGASVLPVFEYGHDEGISVTGGYVYRGRPASTLLTGTYVFGDLIRKQIWRAVRGADGVWSKSVLFEVPFDLWLASFGEDEGGGLFFVDIFNGALYQIVPYTFADVPPQHFAWRFVEPLYEGAVTTGCGGDNYCPDASTTRGQMAVFLLRSRFGPAYLPPPCTNATFADVPCSHPFAAWIYDLVARAVTGGCGGGLYCPDAPVTREQMAVFLLRTAEGPAYTPPPCVTPLFADVPCTSPFAAWINELAARGITGGCGGSNYCPLGVVTRAQMAVFLVVTFGLPPI
jgi:glucose/arabinose dehydrogenase